MSETIPEGYKILSVLGHSQDPEKQSLERGTCMFGAGNASATFTTFITENEIQYIPGETAEG